VLIVPALVDIPSHTCIVTFAANLFLTTMHLTGGKFEAPCRIPLW
jgi:hypothetical protein